MKIDWPLILLGLSIVALVITNEIGLGPVTSGPLLLFAVWMMFKVFPRTNDK